MAGYAHTHSVVIKAELDGEEFTLAELGEWRGPWFNVGDSLDLGHIAPAANDLPRILVVNHIHHELSTGSDNSWHSKTYVWTEDDNTRDQRS
jgi:hypothetical protein